jgi:hypothetical protein
MLALRRWVVDHSRAQCLVTALVGGDHGHRLARSGSGLYRMFFPSAPQGGENVPTYAVIAGLFSIGCLLTAMSRFAREV